MVRHVAPGSVAYDIGANIGIHTLLLSRLVGQSGQVYAFEPVPALYNRLCENMRLNPSLIAARPIQLALCDRNEIAAFYSGHQPAPATWPRVGPKPAIASSSQPADSTSLSTATTTRRLNS